jgi:hypothetical protein
VSTCPTWKLKSDTVYHPAQGKVPTKASLPDVIQPWVHSKEPIHDWAHSQGTSTERQWGIPLTASWTGPDGAE